MYCTKTAFSNMPDHSHHDMIASLPGGHILFLVSFTQKRGGGGVGHNLNKYGTSTKLISTCICQTKEYSKVIALPDNTRTPMTV